MSEPIKGFHEWVLTVSRLAPWASSDECQAAVRAAFFRTNDADKSAFGLLVCQELERIAPAPDGA